MLRLFWQSVNFGNYNVIVFNKSVITYASVRMIGKTHPRQSDMKWKPYFIWRPEVSGNALKIKLASDFQMICVKRSFRMPVKSPIQHLAEQSFLCSCSMETHAVLLCSYNLCLPWMAHLFIPYYLSRLFLPAMLSQVSSYLEFLLTFHTFKFSYFKFPHSWQSILPLFTDDFI